jgi:hypothetical protein
LLETEIFLAQRTMLHRPKGFTNHISVIKVWQERTALQNKVDQMA